MPLDSVMPSKYLIPWHHLLLPSVFPSIAVFSSELALHIRWSKYWSFSISLSSEYSRLISFRIDWLDLFAVQGTLESSPAPQFESINSSVLSLLYGLTLTSIHDYWKNHNFDYMDLCQQSNIARYYCTFQGIVRFKMFSLLFFYVHTIFVKNITNLLQYRLATGPSLMVQC